MEKELKCTCGVCNVCKTRIRMRELRVRKSALSETSAGPESWTDNIGIWVEGADHFEELVQDRMNQYRREIQDARTMISSFSVKERRNNTLYWYQWFGGLWKYVGPVNGSEDPRISWSERVEEIKQDMKQAERNMLSCVLKRPEGDYSDHLVINIELFKRYVRNKLPGGMFKLSEILKPTGVEQ